MAGIRVEISCQGMIPTRFLRRTRLGGRLLHISSPRACPLPVLLSIAREQLAFSPSTTHE